VRPVLRAGFGAIHLIVLLCCTFGLEVTG
jgi:hypothetical protein